MTVRVLSVFLTSLLLLGCGRGGDEHVSESAVEEQGPLFEFSFETVDIYGEPFDLDAHKGQVVIVDFWGTWCPPCRDEIPSFIRLHEKYAEQGLVIVGVTFEQASPDQAQRIVQKFASAHGIPYRLVLGEDDIYEQVPGLQALPTTLFLDRQGRVRTRLEGFHPYSELEKHAVALLQET